MSATSAGVPARRSGCRAAMCPSTSGCAARYSSNRAVLIEPRAIALARIPCGPWQRPPPGSGLRLPPWRWRMAARRGQDAEPDGMRHFTIAPARRLVMKWLTAVWQPVTARARLAVISSSTSLAVLRSRVVSRKTAALFTYPASGPACSATSAACRATAGSAASPLTRSTSACCQSSWAITSRTTTCPDCARRSAMARPTPCAAPVTTNDGRVLTGVSTGSRAGWRCHHDSYQLSRPEQANQRRRTTIAQGSARDTESAGRHRIRYDPLSSLVAV